LSTRKSIPVRDAAVNESAEALGRERGQ
jgi:hypothetical protein